MAGTVGHPAQMNLKALAQAVIARSTLRQNRRNPLLPPDSPAYSIIQTCQNYGVLLRIDPATGDLVVGKAGATADEPTQQWPSLIKALEAHLDDVTALVNAGWTLKAEMPRKPVA